MINEKGKCYDCGKEGEGNLCTECFEKNHMINEKPKCCPRCKQYIKYKGSKNGT